MTSLVSLTLSHPRAIKHPIERRSADDREKSKVYHGIFPVSVVSVVNSILSSLSVIKCQFSEELPIHVLDFWNSLKVPL